MLRFAAFFFVVLGISFDASKMLDGFPVLGEREER